MLLARIARGVLVELLLSRHRSWCVPREAGSRVAVTSLPSEDGRRQAAARRAGLEVVENFLRTNQARDWRSRM